MPSTNSRKIAVNTTLLYIRMAIVMVASLYTVRLVIGALGLEDYGLYDVVAGIVIMFQSISGVISSSVQRFYSIALGKNDSGALAEMFSAGVNVFVGLALISLLSFETLGLWFLNTHIVIPEGRVIAANLVYQFAIFSLVFSLIQTPYLSAVIAYEDMKFYAYVSLMECFLKLVAAFLLPLFLLDRLALYGGFLCGIAFVSFTVYYFIVKCRYKSLKYHFGKNMYNRSIMSFSGWTFYSSVAGIGMNQICTILVNLFYGPLVNASRAIAFQVGNALNSFCASFMMALRPPMIKTYAEGNFEYLNKLFDMSNKVIFYPLLALFLPLFFEMDTILLIWLKTNNFQTILFSRLMLIYSIILALSNPITFIMHAVGCVKQYHLVVETPFIFVMPLTYLAYKIGAVASSTYALMIIAALFSHVSRVLVLKKYYPSFDLEGYCYNISRSMIVAVFSFAIVYYFRLKGANMLLTIVQTTIISIMTVLFGSLFIGLTHSERKALKSFVAAKIRNMI